MRVLPWLACLKCSNAWGRKSGLIPTPSSCTLRRAFSPSASTRTCTVPPSPLNFTALAARFQTTCCSRSGSASTLTGPGPRSTARWMRRLSAAGRTASSPFSTTERRSTGVGSIRNLPVTMRETSSRSSISCACRRALRSITSSACADLARRHLLVAQHRGPAQDRRERRAQLVRQRRQELVLELVVALGGLARFLLAHQLEAGLLGELAEGDVAREQVDEALLPEGGGGPRQPAVAAVGVAVAVLEARGRRALHELAQLVEHRLAVVGVQEVDDRARAQLVVREAEAALPARVQLERAALEVGDREQVRGQREEAVAPRLEVEPVGGFGQALGVLALLAQPPPLRLLANLLAPPEELDEHRDLRPQHLGLDRELDVVDRPQRVAACHAGLELAHRGHEDDRRLLGAGPPADQAGGLEAVELRHVDVEQDHRELVTQERAQRLVPGARGRHLHAEVRQDRLERQQLVGAVVDQQHVHGRGRLFAQCDVSGMGHR